MKYEQIIELGDSNKFNLDEQKDILRLFSNFLAANQECKYNVTYFTGLIDKFLKDMNKFYEKYKMSQRIYEECFQLLISDYKNPPQIIILIDDIFECNLYIQGEVNIRKEVKYETIANMCISATYIRFINDNNVNNEYLYKIENKSIQYIEKEVVEYFRAYKEAIRSNENRK